MNIYLGYSSKNIDQHIDEFRFVRDILLKNGHKIVRDHTERILKDEQKKESAIRPTDIYYKEVMGAIDQSELCIFMANEQTMALGYQVMYSAGKKKYTLVLGSSKNKIPIEHVFIAGSGSAYLDFKSYANTKDLEKYIQRFITKNSKQTRARLSLYLEKPLYDALVSRAKKEERTKSEMLEVLIAEWKKDKPKTNSNLVLEKYQNNKIIKNKQLHKVRLDVKIDTDLNDFLDKLSNLNKTSKIDEIKNILASSH